MSKKQAALQEETQQGAAPAQAQETAAPSVESAGSEEKAADPEPEADPAQEAAPVHVVVLAHPGTEPLVKRIWDKFYDLPIIVGTFQEGDTLRSVLENIMAIPEVNKTFVVIPANLVPCAPVRWSELQTPRADDQGNGKLSFWGRVPVRFDKDVLVDFLPGNDTLSDEEFVKAYATGTQRPDLVSHSYGNFYTKVLRANPCESVVIEGLIRKRFIYASAAGWGAVRELLIQALL